jgi:hypothetical protein
MTPQFIMRMAINSNATEQDRRNALNEIDNLRDAPSYAKPGYRNPKKCVLCSLTGIHLISRLTDLLERYGFSCEWSDE